MLIRRHPAYLFLSATTKCVSCAWVARARAVRTTDTLRPSLRRQQNGTATAHAWSWQGSVGTPVECIEAPAVGVAGFATIDPRLPVQASRGSAAGELRLFRGQGVEMWLRGEPASRCQ